MKNKPFEDPFLKILPKLDLHGETRGTIKFLIYDFLKVQTLLGKDKVTIVHGRHSKILKEETKDILKRCPMVEKFYLDSFNDGITIVELKKNEQKSSSKNKTFMIK